MNIGIREPVHKWIVLSPEEKDLIDSPFIQRLRRVTQLGMTSQVFPGAVHTRFLHSIGVMHIAGRYANELFPGGKHAYKICRIAGLLHDIGHGPFSHLWDDTVYKEIYGDIDKGHDLHRFKLIEHSDLSRRIEKCGVTVQEIKEAWTHEPFRSIIQGDIGADRMDYMMRDAMFTGTEHFGMVAIDRIIHNSFIEDSQLKYDDKVTDEIQIALRGREFMYSNIYQHRVVEKATELMKHAIRLGVQQGMPFVEMTRDLNQFHELDEHFVWGWLRINGNDKIKDCVRQICQRQFPKKILCE